MFRKIGGFFYGVLIILFLGSVIAEEEVKFSSHDRKISGAKDHYLVERYLESATSNEIADQFNLKLKGLGFEILSFLTIIITSLKK